MSAIVVPSARPAAAVVHAARLAKSLATPLIVLASRSAVGKEIAAELAPLEIEDLYIVDFPETLPESFLKFQTSKVLEREGLSRNTDVSAKRNLALAVCRMAGLRAVAFLDDDMTIPEPADLGIAAGLLSDHDAVGLRLAGFPDNSVVCHARRETGGNQDTFVGGGALVVATDRTTSIFPDIYNEDWLFLLNGSTLRPVTVTGRAVQETYDPFASVERARVEEFGDVIAEGIFAILDKGGRIADANKRYWKEFIAQRRALINSTIRRAFRANRKDRNDRMIRSLLAARGRLDAKVKPKLCVEYIRAWQQDLDSWRLFCEDLPAVGTIDKAFDYFDLSTVPVIDAAKVTFPAEEPQSASTHRVNLFAVLVPAALLLYSLALGLAQGAQSQLRQYRIRSWWQRRTDRQGSSLLDP